MADVLVVYFSRSGTTERLARQLAERLKADLEAVRPATAYAGAGGYLKAVWESLRRRAPVVECQRSPRDYRAVVIATPVWAGRLSAPLRGYLQRFAGQFGPLAAVWVSGSGMAYEAVGSEIERLAGRRLWAKAAFSEREVRKNEHRAKLQDFVQILLR